MTTQHAAFHPLRVAAIDELTDDSVAITFDVPEELRADYAFAHGQHLNIRGGDDVRRSYSICTPPSSGVLRIGVKQLPGGAFSEDVVGRLRIGDELEVSTPAGRFTTELDPAPRGTTSPSPRARASRRCSRSWRRSSRVSRGRSSPWSTPTGPAAR